MTAYRWIKWLKRRLEFGNQKAGGGSVRTFGCYGDWHRTIALRRGSGLLTLARRYRMKGRE
jgi:hypothetical protein